MEEPVSFSPLVYDTVVLVGLRFPGAWLLTPPASRVQGASKPHWGLQALNKSREAGRSEHCKRFGIAQD